MSFYEDGIKFECTRCGNCCTCEGYVFIFRKDLDELEKVYDRETLEKNYLSTYGEYVVLRDKADKSCIFWDNEIKGCKVYMNRPTQCRTYPFWNTVLKTEKRFTEELSFCPGIGHGRHYTKEEIDNLRKKF